MTDEPPHDTDAPARLGRIDTNLYAEDVALQEAVAREGAGPSRRLINAYGLFCGSEYATDLAAAARRSPLRYESHDPLGNRIDRVIIDPAETRLIEAAVAEGMAADIAGPHPSGPHPPGAAAAPGTAAAAGGETVSRAAAVFLSAQLGTGHLALPVASHAALAALASAMHASGQEAAVSEVLGEWQRRASARRFDPSASPWSEKATLTLGLALAEPPWLPAPGDAPVLAGEIGEPRGRVTVTAKRLAEVRCDADGLLLVAQQPASPGSGPTLVLVPALRDDGRRNGRRLVRRVGLIGGLARATVETEIDAAEGIIVGREGEAAGPLLEARARLGLDTATMAAGLLRQLVSLSRDYVAHTHRGGAFMAAAAEPLCADVAIASEAATALVFRLARSADLAGDVRARAWRRLMTPVTVLAVTAAARQVAGELQAASGGLGMVDQLALRPIADDIAGLHLWTGASPATAAEVLSVLQHAPEAVEIVLEDLLAAAGDDPHLRRAHARIEAILHEPRYLDRRVGELADALGQLAAATILRAHAPAAVADAFIATRCAALGRHTWGQGLYWADTPTILARAWGT
ncbi:MAG: hypothetical protein NW205_01670 [Hyphomicrobiaceae bacterium]|nr:hypothetical protein [Hyphomicrobiaceae bacterium]